MSNYIKFRDILKDRVSSMMQNNEHLYVVDVSKQEIWDTYLNSFKEGEERQHYNCNCCYKYLKNIGKLVEIVEIDGKLIRKSIWDNLDGVPAEYHDTINALHSLIKSKPIYSVFYSKETEYGKDHNFKELEDGSSIRWDHFHCEVENDFVKGSDAPTYRNNINSRTRSLVKSLAVHKEIWLVLKELIQLNKIAKSESWEWAVDQMINVSAKFQEEPNELYAWKYASGSLYLVGSKAFGVLVKDLNEDSDLITQIKDKSVEEIKNITREYFETEKGKEGLRSYNHITDPRYYQQMQKAASLRQIKEAEEFLSKEGYMRALDRVHATVNDITVPNTLFIDRSSETAKKLNVFEKMKADTKTKLNKEPETITSNEFLKLLPEVQKMEVFFSKEMINHLMVMTAPADKTAPSLLKWDNNYGFNYKGGYAGSVRERVKQAGGQITGDLVCSLGWYNYDDLDLHCRFENKNRKEHICFSSRRGQSSKAQLDVDANAGISSATKTPVENIYVNSNDLREGTYAFYVNQFSKRENKDGGFEIHLTILGENYTYFHDNTANTFGNVKVCDVTVGNNNEITINHHIQPSVENSTNSFEMWGMKTETWQPVTVVSPSPNFWDNNQVGEKHYFFFLANCIMPDTERPQGFFNEFLSQELSKYKRVLQDAGRRIEVPYSTDQLSGLGFQKARNQSAIVKVSGNRLNKVFNVQF